MAEWIYNDYDNAWVCQLCGFYWHIINDHTPKENGVNFCPKCGVKVKGFISERR